jgi:hypothetical protein
VRADWEARVVWEGEAQFQGVAIGDADPGHPGLEAVGCTETGDIVLVRFDGGTPSAELVWSHGAKLTGLLVADLDPGVPGSEVYASGAAPEGGGGMVLQLAFGNGPPRARTILADEGFVHAMAALPASGERPTALAAVTYAGHVLVAEAGADAWTTRVVHREDPDLGAEGIKLKDVAAGAVGGRSPRTLVVACKSGRCLVLDADEPGEPEVVHVEPGGIARLSRVHDGQVWLACNDGRVLSLRADAGAWRARTIACDIDELRGVVVGDFGSAAYAICGYTGCCRLLQQNGRAWDSITIFQDDDVLHWIAAGDLVRGNDADELVVASESGRMTVLVYRLQRAARN